MNLVKKILFVVDPHQSQNKIFDNSVSNPVNRDDGTYPFFLLKNKLNALDIEISTQDMEPLENADLLLFLDIPLDFTKYSASLKKYLIITESELIKPQNWNLENHKYFEKIFTWNDDFVDNKKYFKLNFSNKIRSTAAENFKRTRFCCLIAGKKSVNHTLELYSKRVEAIRWFEKNKPQLFDLYGVGWDLHQFTGPIWLRAFNRIHFLRQILAAKFPSYKGKVSSKLQTLLGYQFSICFENAHGISGYITEKIFDSLFAGCIPIYWGAPNVTEFIPESCFIDFRKYKNFDELFDYLINMDQKTIIEYQNNIYNYLNSEQVKPFSAEYFAEKLTQEIIT